MILTCRTRTCRSSSLAPVTSSSAMSCWSTRSKCVKKSMVYVTTSARLASRGRSVCGASLYSLLGVSSAATAEEVRRAFRQRAKQLHPDRASYVNTKCSERSSAQYQVRAVQLFIVWSYVTSAQTAKKRALWCGLKCMRLAPGHVLFLYMPLAASKADASSTMPPHAVACACAVRTQAIHDQCTSLRSCLCWPMSGVSLQQNCA